MHSPPLTEIFSSTLADTLPHLLSNLGTTTQTIFRNGQKSVFIDGFETVTMLPIVKMEFFSWAVLQTTHKKQFSRGLEIVLKIIKILNCTERTKILF
jgi:hypothetical protein